MTKIVYSNRSINCKNKQSTEIFFSYQRALSLSSTIKIGSEYIQFTEEYYRKIGNKEHILLDEGKIYVVDYLERKMLFNQDLRITAGSNRAQLLMGKENYDSYKHGNFDKELFYMHDNSSLVIDNVDLCQPKQLQTVNSWNPRIAVSAQVPDIQWTIAVRNCNTRALGDHGGFGMEILYGSPKENHVALINFQHYGSGLLDAKNPYPDSIMYVTLRDVHSMGREKTALSKSSFEVNGTLKDGILTIDDTAFLMTSGYNYLTPDNFVYLVLWDRYTFFLEPELVGQHQLKVRKQAEGKCTFGVENATTLYSNEFEMHAGDTFEFEGLTYTVKTKNRRKYPLFDPRTTEAKTEPEKGRSLLYTLDKALPIGEGFIEINYKGAKIEFLHQKVTLSYLTNDEFLTDLNTQYRQSNLIKSFGIGKTFYCHSDISMDARNVSMEGGFYRGSEKGKGISKIWNMYNCTGFEESKAYFMHALPLTNIPDLPLHPRIKEVLEP